MLCEFNIIMTPPNVIDFIVTFNYLPDLMWECRVHNMKVGIGADTFTNIVEYLPVTETIISGLEIVGFTEDCLETLIC